MVSVYVWIVTQMVVLKHLMLTGTTGLPRSNQPEKQNVYRI